MNIFTLNTGPTSANSVTSQNTPSVLEARDFAGRAKGKAKVRASVCFSKIMKARGNHMKTKRNQNKRTRSEKEAKAKAENEGETLWDRMEK